MKTINDLENELKRSVDVYKKTRSNETRVAMEDATKRYVQAYNEVAGAKPGSDNPQ